MIKKYWVAIGFIGIILLGNGYIYWTTQNKMKSYPSNPPFRLDDYTKSYKVSSLSQISNALDKNKDTNWKKLSEGLVDKDWDMELSLTHFWNGKKFIPKSWKTIEILPCDSSDLVLSLILREAINVDKILRLPEDFIQSTKTFQTQPGIPIYVDLQFKDKLLPTEIYPEGIYIITLRAKYKGLNGCVEEIRLIPVE
jgi:hypothetical protein